MLCVVGRSVVIGWSTYTNIHTDIDTPPPASARKFPSVFRWTSLFFGAIENTGQVNSYENRRTEESEEEKRNKKNMAKFIFDRSFSFFCHERVLARIKLPHLCCGSRSPHSDKIKKSYIDTQYWWQLAIQDDDKIALFTSIVSFHRDINILRHTRAQLDEIWQKCISTLRRMPKKPSHPAFHANYFRFFFN